MKVKNTLRIICFLIVLSIGIQAQTIQATKVVVTGTITENAANNSTAGLTLNCESGQFGGCSTNTIIHAGGSVVIPGTTTCAGQIGQLFFPGNGTDPVICQATGRLNNVGTTASVFVLNTFGGISTSVGGFSGFYGDSGSGLQPDSLYRGAGTCGNLGGLGITSNYTDDNNWSAFTTTSFGSCGATQYSIYFTHGSPATPLTTVIFGGWTGVQLNVVGGSTQSFHVTTSGTTLFDTLAASTATPVCFGTGNSIAACVSLRKYKKDIKTYNSKQALSLVMRLNPVSFTSKTDSRKEMGFIAEEVEAIEPRLSTYGQLEAKGAVGDKDNPTKILAKASNQEIVLTGVDYGHMTALLTSAFQEYRKEVKLVISKQAKQIKELQEEIKVLEREINESQ